MKKSRHSQADPKRVDNEDLLNNLQRVTFDYFWHEVNSENGLVADSTRDGSPASTATVGFALTIYPIAVTRGFITHDEAVARTLTTLRFLWESPQGMQHNATGYKGFFYHFLHMEGGQRFEKSELSTIDTAFLLTGALTAAQYFQGDDADESEIRHLANALYRRADWQWAQDGAATVTMGWTPENGFLPNRWYGYSEALLLYILALGSPTMPLDPACYSEWTKTYRWDKFYGYELLYAGPLFIHQFPHLWIDFRQIQDEYMRNHGIDYFENSRRATYMQQQYAIENPHGFKRYGEQCWGITACDGPDDDCKVDGKLRHFYGYLARGVPHGPDDGTLAPWAAVASLPFAPEIVLPTLRFLTELHLQTPTPYGFKCSFNPTYPAFLEDGQRSELGWVSPWHLGINQGPIVIMAENYRSGLIWQLMRSCPYLVTGLQRAGFSGGWLAALTEEV
ncbi:MAG: glucoamylase family protein [Caldilineaceae bacterium]